MANQIRFLGILAVVTGLTLPGGQSTAVARERICIDDTWRFTKDDPPDCAVSLIYDLPVGTVVSSSNLLVVIIKPWVLPTGNKFIDPERRFKRPQVAYVQTVFDDSSWQEINLPHDWAITGPFSRAGGGGMGRLPAAGVGWYRKGLDIPAADSGKRIYLDVDGAMAYAAVWLNGRFVGGWPFGYASWRLIHPDTRTET